VRYVSHSASTPQGPKGVTTLRISGRVRGGSFVDPATPAASPNVKGAQENTSVSAKSWEPLCYTPFSQVVSDRRRGRETLSWRPVTTGAAKEGGLLGA
jgi:hypothetical protein